MDDCLYSLIHQAEQASVERYHKRKAAHERGEDFNIFPVCKVDHYETIHSAILAELFNPSGIHGQEDAFMKLFLQQLAREAGSDATFFEQFNSKKAHVRTEYVIPNGRLDILIQSEDFRHAIIIENKIFAPDGESQLFRYSTYAKQTWGEVHFRLLYLTLYGDAPNPNSTQGVPYQNIAYNSTVTSWIQDCILKVYDKPSIREILIQYNNHLKNLTGTTMQQEKNNALLDLMIKHPAGVAEIISSVPSWEDAILYQAILDPLKSFAEENNWTFGHNLNSNKKENGEAFWFKIDTDLEIRFRTDTAEWRKWYYGIIDKRLERPKPHLLPGLTGGNENWPYGWQYLDKHSDWTPQDLTEIATDNGSFLQYLKGTIKQLVSAMKNENVF